MSKSLKNFIDENRSSFDNREPGENVWQRIRASLPQSLSRQLWNSAAVWRAAAVVLLGLSVFLLANRQPRVERTEVAKSQAEFADLESFYSRQIAEKVQLIGSYDRDDEQFTQDFQKLDAMYQVLREEMKNHPGEKVKDALVLNLLIRIDLLNQQINKLEIQSKREPKGIT